MATKPLFFIISYNFGRILNFIERSPKNILLILPDINKNSFLYRCTWIRNYQLQVWVLFTTDAFLVTEEGEIRRRVHHPTEARRRCHLHQQNQSVRTHHQLRGIPRCDWLQRRADSKRSCFSTNWNDQIDRW